MSAPRAFNPVGTNMTFGEVAASLPNGFHDAELQRFEVDYAGDGQPPQSSSTLPAAPAGMQTAWMYLEELNGLLLFSARSASLEWTGPEENRT